MFSDSGRKGKSCGLLDADLAKILSNTTFTNDDFRGENLIFKI